MPTLTLRPIANGYTTEFPSITGGGSVHWVVVSDNSDSTYIRNNTTTPRIDSFALGSTGLTTEIIDSIDVRARVRSESSASGRFLVGLRLGGANSVTDFHEVIPTSETNYTDLAIPRPGGGAWTSADFTAGVEVLAQGNAGSGAGLRIYELYVDINYTATTPPDPPTFREIPTGMAAWWQASAVSGTEGSDVLSWVDSSPNGYDATGVGATKPKLRVGFINSQNSIEFSTTNNFTSTLTASQNIYTIFMVAAPSSTSGNRNVIGADATGGREFRYASATRQNVVRSVLAATASSTPAVVANQFEIATAVWDSLTQQVYVNGTLSIDSSFTPSITAGRTTLIGAGTATYTGKISEIIVYHSKLSVGDRAQVHSYLQDKYGITVSDYVPPITDSPWKRFNGTEFVNVTMVKI